jgi:hypothetical protein
VAWNFFQPVGRMTIAQRFIAGVVRSLRAKSRRDERTLWLEREAAKRDFFRPYGTLFVFGRWPSDKYKSLGYFRSSLRDFSRGNPSFLDLVELATT